MTTFVKARCHCGLNAFNIAFSTASLPLSSVICHCSSCRHSSGQMFRNYIPFEGEPISLSTNQPTVFKNLTSYDTTPLTTRLFCTTCSAHMLARSKNPVHSKNWYVAVGALEQTKGIAKPGWHIWIGDTLDGGVSDHLRILDGVEIPRCETWPGVEGKAIPVGWREALDGEHGKEELFAHCRCNSISFSITRPSAASALPKSPYPDLLLPHHSTLPSILQNPDDEKWWLRPLGSQSPERYLAGHCACSSCRLTAGSEVQGWAFIPRANILIHTDASESPVSLDLNEESKRPKQLKQYASSGVRRREFCRKCGASIFSWDHTKAGLVAVATGLLNEKQGGARAEDWLEWYRDRVSFAEEATSKGMIEELVYKELK